jgi:Na+/proline symporter
MVLYPVVPAAEQTAGFVAGRELLFAQGIKDLLPPGISGLMLTGLLAALASTLDTHMNWGAGYWSNDIYRELISRNWLKREPSARELVWVARFSNILIMLIAFIIMSQLGSIQQAWHLSLLFGAGMGAVLVLRWTWERINLYSEMAAMVSSIALAPILLLAVDAEWARLGLMALCSTLAVIIVTLITPPVKEEKLKAFFSRVQPAGFWRKTALKTGTDPFFPVRKLLFASGNIFFVAMTVFSGLAGFGKLMFPVPHESPLWALSGIAMMIVCGFVWRKISRKEAKEIEFHNY